MECLRPNASKTIEFYNLLEDVSIEESIAIEKSWQKTITVPESQDPLIEKLFTAWCKECPSWYTEAFNKYQETGKAKPFVWNGYQMDYSCNKYLEINSIDILCSYKDFRSVKYAYTLYTSIWTLKNGNPLFSIFVGEDVFINMLAFYEYNAAKGTLTPRPDIADKVWNLVGDNNKNRTYIYIKSNSYNVEFFDHNTKQRNKIQWDINEF